ncbi:MAG: regulatory protein RecX [Selenomonadaceae bacterium]|nr:regulatory protein RecX [Selenomonadaceae bacterium]
MRKPRPTALVKATELLARHEQSSKVLRRKLLERGYEEAEVDAAIARLVERKYLDDADACASQFEALYAAETLSVRQICAKLVQRGFDADTIENLIPADTYEHELRAAAKAVEKKFSGQIPDAKTKLKIRQHLAMKGFNSEIISAAVEKFLEVNGD